MGSKISRLQRVLRRKASALKAKSSKRPKKSESILLKRPCSLSDIMENSVGSKMIICVKTGVLSKNRLEVEHLWLGDQLLDATSIDATFRDNVGFMALAR